MTELSRHYDVTITVDRDGCDHPNAAESAELAEQAASVWAASIVSAHTASQIVSIVTVLAADQPAAVAVALAVVSEALRCPADALLVIPAKGTLTAGAELGKFMDYLCP